MMKTTKKSVYAELDNATKDMSVSEVRKYIYNLLEIENDVKHTTDRDVWIRKWVDFKIESVKTANNYRCVNIDCCRYCKHFNYRIVDESSDWCDLISYSEYDDDAGVWQLSICDKFERIGTNNNTETNKEDDGNNN